MSREDELGVLAEHVAIEMLQLHKTPDARDDLMQRAVEPLSLAETMQVSGMVISLLCDAVDSITSQTPQMRANIDHNLARAKASLSPLPGWATL